MKKNTTRGFTLIELMVAVTIIALLSSIIASVFTDALAGARDAKRYAVLSQMRGALEMYRIANAAYPSTGGDWWGVCSIFGSRAVTGSSGYVPNLAPTYIPVLPVDPRSDSSGCFNSVYGGYLYRSDGINYKFLIHGTIELKKECDTATDVYWDPFRSASSMECSIYTPGAAMW